MQNDWDRRVHNGDSQMHNVSIATYAEDGHLVSGSVIQLPAKEAKMMCNALASVEEQARIVQESISHTNTWANASAWSAATGLGSKLAAKQTAWLNESSAKYINLRVDMRGGDFMITRMDGGLLHWWYM